MLKRMFDFAVALGLTFLLSPVIVATAAAIAWRMGLPVLFRQQRPGLRGRPFEVLKFRTMAEAAGADGQPLPDEARLMPLGALLRRFSLDELPQLFNVLKGDMSLVGPRPNVKRETDLYTREEKKLLSVRPGITDFASIVFSDEADILDGKPDPDIAYNQLIRPGKSRLGLFYVENSRIWVDIQLIWLTAVSSASRSSALRGVAGILQRMNAPADLVDLARRDKPLIPAPPPGATQIVTSRDAVAI